MAGEYWLALRADGCKGQGTASDPLDASSPFLFGALMKKFADDNPNGQVCIHIGPGIFQVPAHRPLAGSWRPHAGWRMVGAGKYATTLKVTNALADYHEMQVAVGNDVWQHTAEGFTIEDLTIDCNMRGHKDMLITLGAIYLGGSRTKVRRVRVFDFGTERDKECFPINMAQAVSALPEPRDCQINDCLIEHPSPNNVRETTVLGYGSGDGDDNGNPAQGQPSIRGKMFFHRSCLMRKNRIDCDYSVDPRQIKEIRFTGTSATARTFQPHNRKVGDWVLVSGALVADSLENPYNGSFQLTAVPGAHEFSYTMQSNPGVEPTGTMWLNRFSSHLVDVENITPAGNGPWIITLTTRTPHFRVPGDNVVVQNVRKEDGQFSPISIVDNHVAWHKIIDVLSPTTFRFAMLIDPQAPLNWSVAMIGVSFQAWGVNGGVAALGERNRVFGAWAGGPYTDTFSTKDMTVQKNYYYNVIGAVNQNMGGVSEVPFDDPNKRYADTLTRGDADGKTATLTAPFVHGLVAGQLVRVTNAHVSDNISPAFNGFFVVEKVPSPKSFAYRMTADPGLNADTNDPEKLPIFGAVWQIGRIICHRNTIELVAKNPQPSGRTYGFAIGNNTPVDPFYIFRDLLVRGNFVRPADGAIDEVTTAVGANWVENMIVQRNVFSGLAADPLGYHQIGTVYHFNNQTNAGRLVQARLRFPYTLAPSVDLNQLETEVDLALTVRLASKTK
jgi:hypothetical protein